MQARDHEGALRKYDEALTACEGAAPAFAAVLHSNRAAAFQARDFHCIPVVFLS